MPLVSAGRAVWANVLKCCESLVNAIVKKIATEVPASIFFKPIRLSRICKFPRLGKLRRFRPMWPVVALTDKANRCGMRNVQLFRLDPNPKLFEIGRAHV